MSKIKTITIASLGLIWTVGCGSDSSSPMSASGTDTTTNTRTIKDNPSFSNDIQEIFQRNGCTNAACHGAATSAGLNLQSGVSFGSLVNVPATSEPIVRVIPGNADGSYLVIKLENRQSVGTRMPQGGQPLGQIDLTNIRNWISQGANNN